ncbi:MAG: hypothetical protein R2703_06845 [Micropruina glycogenica]
MKNAEEHALADREVGTLLIRDAPGRHSRTRFLPQGREDLPKIIRAGRHIARRSGTRATSPRRSNPTSWSARWSPRPNAATAGRRSSATGSTADTGDLSPLWPTDVAKAIEAAHEHGAQVTAHCFGERSVTELVDSHRRHPNPQHRLVSGDTIAAMAERQVSLVPAAGEPGAPVRRGETSSHLCRHIAALYERRL